MLEAVKALSKPLPSFDNQTPNTRRCFNMILMDGGTVTTVGRRQRWWARCLETNVNEVVLALHDSKLAPSSHNNGPQHKLSISE
jgi:hypothetical protein